VKAPCTGSNVFVAEDVMTAKLMAMTEQEPD